MNISIQFRRLAVAGLVAGGLWGAVASRANNPPVPTCTTSTCQMVQGPSGWIAYTNVAFWPESVMCLGEYVYAWPEEDWRCSETITATVWTPPGAKCPPSYYTNASCPYFTTNWWVLNYPGQSASGAGSYPPPFLPTNCGEGTITFYGTWRNTHPCTGNPIGGETISIPKSFTVKCGLLKIILEGNGTGPLWTPDWATNLVNALAALQQSPFSFSALPNFATTTLTNYSLFCCTNGGSGMVNLYYWRANISETGFGVSASLSLLDALPAWLQTPVEAVQAAFPDATNLISEVVDLINVGAGFEANGQADWKQVTFSDECWECTDNPAMGFGTSTANLTGEIAVHSPTFGVHLVALAGYVTAQTQGWAQYIGPLSTDSDWYVQTHYTWLFYSSYVIGQQNGIHYWLPQGGTNAPNPAVPVPVCLGPNFVAP